VDAIVTAGGIPQPGEPLYEESQGLNKALLDIAGKPMIQWVLDALCQAESIDQIVIIGLPEGSGVTCHKATAWLSNHGGLLENIRAGVIKAKELNPQAGHLLSVSSDIPAITPEVVNWAVSVATDPQMDIYYNIISRNVMESRYPTSKRSYTRLKGLEVCGGDMNVIHTRTVTHNNDLWDKIIDSRKNVFKQASLIGYDTLILLLLRLIDLEAAEKMVTRRLKIKGKAVVCPYAEIGMDVDKPFQLEIMRNDLAQSARLVT
jgi:GTP:adenosylcobinamide-phosphate guanylyltransferase